MHSFRFRWPVRDVRLAVTGVVIVGVALVGLLVRWAPNDAVVATDPARPDFSGAAGALTAVPASTVPEAVPPAASIRVDPLTNPDGHRHQAEREEIAARFQQALVMLHANRHDEALVALGRIMQINPNIPDVLVNFGFALIGKGDYESANAYFQRAIELNPGQANAYYGIALAQEGAGNLEGALGGMRAFLHLNPNKDPSQIHIARARSAIWEWEARLGRGPWGPTQGIPPGLAAADIKRDGRGVAYLAPIPGTEQPDGRTLFEIRHQDRIPYPMLRP